MFREDDSLSSVNAQSATPRPSATGRGAPRAGRRGRSGGGEAPGDAPHDEAFETSRLLVELLHAAHASRRTAEVHDLPASAAGARDEPASDHAIRAAIHLYQHGERTIGQLAAGLGISRGWASRVAEELVARGHATRESDPDDRRVVRLRITEASLAEIERAYRWRGDVVAAALAEHVPEERAAIRRFLRRVATGLAAEADDRT